jgi:predicted DNA-binding ArsR family transcriptional regulator
VSDWATTTATTADSSSLVDINNLVSVVTYPNPTTTDATLEVKGLTEDATVVVMDVNGKVVYRTIYTANQSSMKISTSDLSAGVYYIKVTNSVMTKTQTLIKQ